MTGGQRKVELNVKSITYYPEPEEIRATQRTVAFTAITVAIVGFLLIRVLMV